MKILIAGFGSIGRRHLNNLLKLGYNEIAVFDVDRRSANHLPEESSIPFFDVVADALDWGPKAVFICNPSSMHISMAQQAVARGCHIFVEKPLSHNLDGIDELRSALQAQNLICFVAYVMRFHPGLLAVKACLDQGKLGKVIAVRAQAGQWLPDWRPGVNYSTAYSANAAQGGGVILDLSHEIDYLTWLFGPVAQVLAICRHASSLVIDSEDVAAIILDFKNQVLGELHLDYIQRSPQRECQVIGEQGTLIWDFPNQVVKFYDPETRQWQNIWSDPSYDRNQMYLDELKYFFDCVEGRQINAVDLDQGEYVLRLALLAYESNTTGKRVEVA